MVEHKSMENGFRYIEVTNERARAKIALQGAHLFHYEQKGRKPLLWLSETSFFETGRSIRGGIPVCWPWFGMHKSDPNLPQHGFARDFLWELLEANEAGDNSTELLFELKSSPESMKLWPYRFELRLLITVSDELTVSLTTKNCATEAFEISSALHSYFAVSNIDNVNIEGLEGKKYFDALDKKYKIQKGDILISEEVDRVYQGAHGPIIIRDNDRSVKIKSKGSSSAVVWNPWIEKCARMSAMKNDAYKTMLCIETANAMEDGQTLQPEQEHTLAAIIK
jgi:glucose-6-phosphate 1-epimerase